MPRLSVIARQELDQRGWTLEKFGQRGGFSTSLAHQIVNEGKDNVRSKTFDGIAAAFGMTPTQLRQRIDGDTELAPYSERVARIARLLPDVPEERLDAIEQHVTLAVQPAQRASSGRRDGASTRRRVQPGQIDTAYREPMPLAVSGETIDRLWDRPAAALASAFAYLERLIPHAGRLTVLRVG